MFQALLTASSGMPLLAREAPIDNEGNQDTPNDLSSRASVIQALESREQLSDLIWSAFKNMTVPYMQPINKTSWMKEHFGDRIYFKSRDLIDMLNKRIDEFARNGRNNVEDKLKVLFCGKRKITLPLAMEVHTLGGVLRILESSQVVLGYKPANQSEWVFNRHSLRPVISGMEFIRRRGMKMGPIRMAPGIQQRPVDRMMVPRIIRPQIVPLRMSSQMLHNIPQTPPTDQLMSHSVPFLATLNRPSSSTSDRQMTPSSSGADQARDEPARHQRSSSPLAPRIPDAPPPLFDHRMTPCASLDVRASRSPERQCDQHISPSSPLPLRAPAIPAPPFVHRSTPCTSVASARNTPSAPFGHHIPPSSFLASQDVSFATMGSPGPITDRMLSTGIIKDVSAPAAPPTQANEQQETIKTEAPIEELDVMSNATIEAPPLPARKEIPPPEFLKYTANTIKQENATSGCYAPQAPGTTKYGFLFIILNFLRDFKNENPIFKQFLNEMTVELGRRMQILDNQLMSKSSMEVNIISIANIAWTYKEEASIEADEIEVVSGEDTTYIPISEFLVKLKMVAQNRIYLEEEQREKIIEFIDNKLSECGSQVIVAAKLPTTVGSVLLDIIKSVE